MMTYTEPEVIFVLLVNLVCEVFSCWLWQFVLLIKNIKYSQSLSFNQVCLHHDKTAVKHAQNNS